MNSLRRVLRYCTDTLKACHWLVASALLLAMFIMGITSMVHDSAVVDELAHIPAGYSYLHYGDYRLNPEHPPLLKDLAALPLQFIHLNFPLAQPAWTTEVNGQWDVGYSFLFYSGNNPDQILFWARLPILLLALAFGFFLYKWVLGRYGKAAALLTLFFYSFSPNIIAHARYVTTDLGASTLIFVDLAAFLRWCIRPSRGNTALLSAALALGALSKDSAVILYPFLFVMALIYSWVSGGGIKPSLRIMGRFVLAMAISVVLIWLAYIPETWHMPKDVQVSLIKGTTGTQPGIQSLLIYWAGVPGFKPLVQYLLGIAMVSSRIHGGNVEMFLGAVSDKAFTWYFPVLFAVKTQVAFLVFLVAAAGLGLKSIPRAGARLRPWVMAYWAELVLLLFSLAYIVAAMKGNLDLGIRHILPIYVPLFVLVSVALVRLWRSKWWVRPWRQVAAGAGAGLLVWYGMSTVLAYPYFLPYINELGGGPGNAYHLFSDSSVDWGQDLFRFQDYVKAHPEIKTVALDYFGGADDRYYLCQELPAAKLTFLPSFDCSHSRIQQWHADYGRYTGQYIAVSETYLETSSYWGKLYGYEDYGYLRARNPIAKIGYSIYLYKLY